MSRNGLEKSGLVSSTVNLMLESTELMLFMKLLLWDVFCPTKVSCTYFNYRHGGLGTVLSVLISKLFMKRLATTGLIGNPMTSPSICSYYLPWNSK